MHGIVSTREMTRNASGRKAEKFSQDDTEDILTAFIISVLAGVVCHYICKWLDGDNE